VIDTDPFPYVHPNGRDRYSVPIRLDGVFTEYQPRDWFERSTWEEKARRYAGVIEEAWTVFVPNVDEVQSARDARAILSAAGPLIRDLGLSAPQGSDT